MGYENARAVLDAVVKAYYEERNIEDTIACVTDDIEWVGTESDDSAKGKDELRRLLTDDVSAFPGAFSIQLEEPSVQTIGSDAVLFTVTGEQAGIPGVAAGFLIRGTACAVKTEAGWLLANVHTSVPNSEMEKIALQYELSAEREKQSALLDAVPGGVAIYRAKKDGRIATDYVSDGLARICGYEDGKDIMKVMEYDSRKLVLPEDFPVVGAACKASLETGVPTSVNYRVYGKDGSPVRLTLDSVVMKNVKLAGDDIAVFYAVQTLVNDETIRIMEDQKKMSALLDQMPCGLGLFDYTEEGVYTNYMNNAFYALLGTKREERSQYSGANTLGSAHQDDLPRIHAALKKLADGDSSVQVDYRINKEGSEWVWIHANAVVVKREKASVRLCIAFDDITESKERELQLIQNQNAVALAQNQGGLAIWTFNIDQKLLIQQAPMDVEGHLGYPIRIENVPDCFVENGSIYPDDVGKFLAAYKKVMSGEEKVDEVYRMINQATGKYCWVHMFYQHMDDNMDGDRMAVGFSMDADLQQEAIERYQLEQKLRIQMYSDAIIYVEYNLTTKQYTAYNNFSEIYRTQDWECQTKEQYRENMRRNVDEAYLDEVVEKMYAENLLKAFESGKINVSCEYRSKERPDLPANWYSIVANIVQNPSSGDVMAFLNIRNIEEEVVRRLALESSMRDGIESVAVIHITDGKSMLIRSNFAMTPKDIGQYFIYDDYFVERSHKMVVPEERDFSYHAALLAKVRSELETQNIYQYSVSMQYRDGTLKRQLFRFRYLDDRRVDVVMSISDITEIYYDEQDKKEQLKEALSKAEEANKSKTMFLSNMSHDMRTTMNAIIGLSNLAMDFQTVEELKDYMVKINLSGKQLLDLINDTLDVSRIENGKLTMNRDYIMSSVLSQEVVASAKVVAEQKGVVFRVEQEGFRDALLYIDVVKTIKIFTNLLSNAVKFTPSGGEVVFTLHRVGKSNHVANYRLVIRDTGIGMSREFLKHIFEPFAQERTDRATNATGTGLGMTIVKEFADFLGAKLEIKSELGEGTEVTVWMGFQLADKLPEELQKKELPVSEGNHRILVAEDHPLNAEIIKKLLEKKGYQVERVTNGKECVSNFIHSAPGYYGLILMDVRMPEMDGMEAARTIRLCEKEDARSIPIIAMTANAFEQDVKDCLNAGMNAHLSKPVEPEKLYGTLEQFFLENVK